MLSLPRCLLLMASMADTSGWAAGNNFNVMDYGARNDGSALATGAFRAAIQAAKAAGGGTVYVPAGKYLTGPIELVSNLVLDIDAGAVLQFQTSRQDLSFTRGRLEGTDGITPIPLIAAGTTWKT